MAKTPLSILVVGGSGYVGKSMIRNGLKKGLKMISVSRKGKTQ